MAPGASTGGHGNVVGFGSNHHQAWLWDCWQSSLITARDIIGNSPCGLLFNGDAIEGMHHHSEEVTSPDVQDHLNAAVECLKPWADMAQKVWVTQGTECHTRTIENALAKLLGAVDSTARGKWLIEINGCLIDATHHMPTTSKKAFESNGLAALMVNARANCLDMGHRIPSVFLRGHRHCGGFYQNSSGLFGVTGGWQFLTRFGYKAVPDSIPSPTILILDWTGKQQGSLPNVHEIKHTPPQPEISRA